VLTRRNLLSLAAGTAATFFIRVPEAVGHPVSEDNFVGIGGIDQPGEIRGNYQFWYLGAGGEVPHDVADNDRIQWRALKDQRTEPQSNGWRPVTIELEVELDELPDLFASGSKQIISPRLRELCDQFKVKAEYLPVKIAQPNGNLWPEQYVVMHPLERIDCINFAASDFDRYGDSDNFIVARFRRLVFRPERIGDRAVFRALRYSPIFASNGFRHAVLGAGLVVEFYAPEGQKPIVLKG
jgi:hypothetical protein